MKRLVSLFGVVGLVCALGPGSAQAASATGARQGRIHGIVFAHGANPFGGGKVSNLTYHNGPVMQTGNTVYAIYWVPPGYSLSANYESLIDQYFGDVAADSGKTSNVYFSDTQYSSIAYNSTFAGQIVDANPFPANGCRDRYTSICLTDAQLQAEIQKDIGTTHPKGIGYEYFLFTPKNVGSCFGSSCAYSYFCAYHSNIGTDPNSTILYANMPYAAFVPNACGSGQSPNGDDADSTINVTSHEHNETITDPLGSAWYDSSGNEDGDKCAWNFGTALGSTVDGNYNQLINNHPYYLQQEWSNHSSGCVLQGL